MAGPGAGERRADTGRRVRGQRQINEEYFMQRSVIIATVSRGVDGKLFSTFAQGLHLHLPSDERVVRHGVHHEKQIPTVKRFRFWIGVIYIIPDVKHTKM